MRVYNSFDEIDRDLRYLQLQKQVDQETMKLNLNEVKESFSAVSVLTSIVSSIAKKAVILKTVNKLIGR
ncbi:MULTISPECIES: DUF6327 family protein [Nonlabens]|mgnify:CR=1 FL=1|uniref:Glutaminyl-tRNA synthetase n=1 Tax=Nonlabens ulvanivorans TaxID=906888 RepID=A0A081D764_NONUL|nr:DUF6327 family protein [Nonlabens ulvanivorans]KEZ92448.1 glutaminyl-tRNA synthetase [Nonlabens ulvanivorans]PRX15284.1 hypothetical protein LY02_00499 [Nonlabens ulvanivorans]WOI22365.1 DUF6327 family protein [Nonlabens ulvanivorans]GAK74760.1 hypothetical protein JCM19296_338 [Nonlabens ulvanivorans]GAK92432.1 hypothetical protein JCM19298_2920 [Nonlabens ulvanivorans]|tara:strand:+ start:1290 stop:1496 length:207 start_codon:yes stop_codon:yes gene_type:complete